jgi:hypothetical protein
MTTFTNAIKKSAVALFLLSSANSYAQYNYEDGLLKAVQFFDANRCGKNVTEGNVFPWRGNCHTTDAANGVDLTGGFHDAGDHVKFGLPQAFSASTLGYALYEFKGAFDRAKATTKTLSTLKLFSDYFLKSLVNANTFYYQVGDGNADHSYWGSPEKQTGSRPTIATTTAKPASDVCGQASAALALMYLNYKSVDAAYANRCLDAAKQIYELGRKTPGRSDDGSGGSFYKSSSHFDDLAWGAIWLSVATGDRTYLDPVDAWMDVPGDFGGSNYFFEWAPNWDNCTPFVLQKMHELTGAQKYFDAIAHNLRWYKDKTRKTPAGLPWIIEWGVLRFNNAEAGLGYVAAKNNNFKEFLSMGDFIVDYTFGTNPRKASYITNYGANPPIHPHHRANEPSRGGPTNGMVGALVGGPGINDDFIDDVNDFRKNEVALDYNASLVLALAGKVHFNNGTPPPANIPPTVSITAPANGASFTAPASINITANAADADGSVTNVQFFNGTTSLGTDNTAPYSFSWTGVAAGTYSITAKATDNRGATTTSAAVSVTVTGTTPPPPPGGGDIEGPACGSRNQTLTFELSAANRVNASSYNWWYNGASASITPVAGMRYKVNIATGPYFGAGQVCVGVNLNGAPYYRSFCKPVTVCSGGRIGDVVSVQVLPNPTTNTFQVLTTEAVASYSVVNFQGAVVLRSGAVRNSRSITMGTELGKGSYLLLLNYQSGKTETKLIQKF